MNSTDRPGSAIPESGGNVSKETPGGQRRRMTKQEALDEALDESFPASDPASPTRIDGPIVTDKGGKG